MAFNMASIEMVDKLRSRTGVTYEEAREALDNSQSDMLDALIWLEKNGKAIPPRVSYYSTDSDNTSSAEGFGDMPYGKEERYYDADNMSRERKAKKDKRKEQSGKEYDRKYRSSARRKYTSSSAYYYDEHDSRARASSFAASAFSFISKAFHVGNNTMLEVKRYGKDIIKIPLTILVIAFIFFFQVILILLPLGLFFGFRYNISGNHFNDSGINSVMDSTADAVDGIKDSFSKKKQ